MKKIVSILIVLLSTLPANAQLSWDKIDKMINSRSTDSLLIKAVEPGLCVIRQQYQIKNKKKKTLHGKNGQNYFGESYSLGVKVAGGMVFTCRVLEPWDGDPDLEKVNGQNEYVPQLYKTTFLRDINGADYREANLDFDKPQYLEPLDGDSLLYRHTEARSDFGFSVDPRFGTSQGYMVWAVADSDEFYPEMRIDLKVDRLQVPDSLAGSESFRLYPSERSHILGGLFIQPVVDRIGHISCHLAGVAVRGKDGWVLRTAGRRETVSVTSGKTETKKDAKRDSTVNVTPIKD